ncbi:MAG TPA: LysM peptidoglycan-binding domain-containing protein, partial [Candidatus Acidoferrum sp.]|nr:LysM peptidoglycan-binding domain-containing protein [Candidatus Acidoferrum sp.]
YDAANHLIQLNDAGDNSVTYYEYDPYDRIERQRTVDGGLVAEDTRTYYDAMGRISGLSGEGYSDSYSYDAAGNRTQINAYYSTGPGAKSQQDLWYGYDAMNRVVISEGVNTSNTVAVNSTQGTILTYDWRGDRTSETTEGTIIITESGASYSSTQGMGYYTYGYDGAARLLNTYVQPSGSSSSPILLESRVYDQASRITQDTTQSVSSGSSSLSTSVQTNTYNADGTVKASSTKVNGLMQSAVAYTYATESGTQSYYDAAGNLLGYVATYYDAKGNPAYSSTNTFTYAHGNSYLETSQSVTSTALESGVTVPQNGETTYTYNGDQQLIQFTDTQKSTNDRYFLDNAQGQQLTVVQGSDGSYGSNTAYGGDSSAQSAFASALMSGTAFFQSAANAAYFFYDSQGNEVGTYGELGGKLTANFDVNFTPVSQQYPAQTPPQYVVQGGDTLASVAMRVYGDASLWYIIAQANGLTQTGPDAALTAGTALTIPNVVVDRANNAQSFAPFNVAEALGNTNPTQPTPPPPQHSGGGGCGLLGEILIMIVAIVATIYTAGLASEAIAGDLTDLSAFGTEAFSTGAAVLAGSTAPITALSIGTDIVSAAIGGALGSVISQGVAIGIGEQSSFNWGSVATSALGSAIGAGLGGLEGLGDTGTLAKTAEAGANALVSGAATQGAEIALGMEKTFNWDAVAAAAIAAPINALVGIGATKLLGNDGVQDVESTFAGKFVSGGVGEIFKEVFKNGQLSGATILTDAFGSAIGNSILTAIAPPPPKPPSAPPSGASPNAAPGSSGGGAPSSSDGVNGDFINLPISSIAGLIPIVTVAAGSAVTATAAPGTDNADLLSGDQAAADLQSDDEQLATNQSQPSTHTVVAGDSISKILGTPDPSVIGEFMRENDLTSSTINPGQQLIMPDGNVEAGDQELGQATLNNDNARLDALRALRQEAAAEQAAVQQAAAATAQSNAAPASQPPPSTVYSATGSLLSGVWNGLKTDGQFIVSASQGAWAWGQGQVNQYQQGGIQATVVGQAYDSTVQAYNSTVNFMSSEVSAYQQGGITNTQTAQALQSAVTTVENSAESAVNYVQTEGLSGIVADGESGVSKMWGNVTNYWDTHSGDQMAYSVGNFIGGQLPIQLGIQTVAVFTGGAGEALEGLDAGLTATEATVETAEALTPLIEEG